MSSPYIAPPERPGLGSTFKRPIDTLLVGNPQQGFIFIGDQVPSILKTFYQTNYGVAPSTMRAIIEFAYPATSGNNVYYYMVSAGSSNGVSQFLGAGFVDQTPTVHEYEVRELNGSSVFSQLGVINNTVVLLGSNNPGGSVGEIIAQKMGLIEASNGGLIRVNTGSFLQVTNGGLLQLLGTELVQSGGTQEFQSGSTLQLDTGSAFNIDGLPAPRGLAYAIQLVGNPIATSVAGAEVALSTTGSFTYKDGRAYKLRIWLTLSTNLANLGITVRVRQGATLAGSIIMRRSLPIPSTTSFYDFYGEGILIVPTGGGNITEQVTFSMLGSAGGNVSAFATGNAQSQIHCEDIGATIDFPGFTQTW